MWTACVTVVIFFNIGCVVSSRGKFKKDGGLIGEDGLNETHALVHVNVHRLRREASIVVVVIFFLLTVGMFFCCRYIPEAIMVKCNY